MKDWNRIAEDRVSEGRDAALVARLIERESTRRKSGPHVVRTGTSAPDKIDRVPNKPKTPVTGIRIPPDLKASAAAKAASEETDLSKVVIRLLKEYVDPPKKRSRKTT